MRQRVNARLRVALANQNNPVGLRQLEAQICPQRAGRYHMFVAQTQ